IRRSCRCYISTTSTTSTRYARETHSFTAAVLQWSPRIIYRWSRTSSFSPPLPPEEFFLLSSLPTGVFCSMLKGLGSFVLSLALFAGYANAQLATTTALVGRVLDSTGKSNQGATVTA